MYIYILLYICSLTAADDNSRFWNIMENIFHVTHDSYVPEDARLNITQLAKKYQYSLEEHTVTTQDGYIINFHRIPNHDGPVVFLMHGILDSADCWLLLGPKAALGYELADKGFDVWMGNARGNKYALSHTALNNSMTKYWQYTWESIALMDLPAMIDYILEKTRHDSLYYVGHSQGTTVGYALCSMRPKYNNKIKMMFSLAPVAWMAHVKSPIVTMFSPAHDLLGFLLSDINTYATEMDFFKKISSFVCAALPGKCDNILYSLSGYETKVNSTFLSVILGHWPTGASTSQFVHYGQLVESKRFCRFDYGHGGNMLKYGQGTPPDYDLSKVTVPVVLFYSPKDWLSDPVDVLNLKSHLRNVKELVFLEDFTHIDYIYASDASPYVNTQIIKHIVNFEQGLARK